MATPYKKFVQTGQVLLKIEQFLPQHVNLSNRFRDILILHS